MTTPKLFVRLVAADAAAALDFYCSALGATELLRFADPSGRIVHSEIQIGDDVVSVTEHDGAVNVAPTALGGTAVLLTLVVGDADTVGAAMLAAGAEVVIPIADQFYGRREGRIRDPFGHLWIISQDSDQHVDDQEVQRRLDDGAG